MENVTRTLQLHLPRGVVNLTFLPVVPVWVVAAAAGFNRWALAKPAHPFIGRRRSSSARVRVVPISATRPEPLARLHPIPLPLWDARWKGGLCCNRLVLLCP